AEGTCVRFCDRENDSSAVDFQPRPFFVWIESAEAAREDGNEIHHVDRGRGGILGEAAGGQAQRGDGADRPVVGRPGGQGQDRRRPPAAAGPHGDHRQGRERQVVGQRRPGVPYRRTLQRGQVDGG